MRAFLSSKVQLHQGDCLEVLPTLAENSIDACMTDPPYHLTNNTGSRSLNPGQYTPIGRPKEPKGGFMGKQWDGGDIAFRPETWAAVYRVLKPGAHLLAFGGTRTFHRMTCAVEDAGFEIRDTIMWLYGSGFPKSHNVAVAIDKTNGEPPRAKSFNYKGGGDRAEEFETNGREFLPPYKAKTAAARQWEGWGTALKPACEPIILARKPLSEKTVAANVLRWGTGAINVDGCRVEHITVNGGNLADNPHLRETIKAGAAENLTSFDLSNHTIKPHALGRWPANVIHDGSEEVVGAFPETTSGSHKPYVQNVKGWANSCDVNTFQNEGNSGSAARFFYCAKADSDNRVASKHPTVKPVDLMRWLVRLITPKGGYVLDPFAGSGTTGEAAWREGMSAILVEREAEYCQDVQRRMALVLAGPEEKAREMIKVAGKIEQHHNLPLFGGGMI